MNNKIRPCLWVDNDLGEMFEFYQKIFKNSKVLYQQGIGGVIEIEGQTLEFLRGGPMFKLNEAISITIACEDQAETDYYWDCLTSDGGAESQCGWCVDKYGLSWQVRPKKLMELLSSSDSEKAKYAQEQMMKMHKIIISDLEK